MSLNSALIRPMLVVLSGVLLQSCGGAADDSDGLTSQQWETVWVDNFDGDVLDRAKWTPEQSCWGGGNNERQCYTDRPGNVRVDNGVLRLIAQAETYTGPAYPTHYEPLSEEQHSQKYTSGKVITHGIADWRYGRFSARIKLPAGQGPWTAFWMMPTDSVYGGWPLSGEIDIMESVNLETQCDECVNGLERRTSGAIHFGGTRPDNTYLFFKDENEEASSPAEEWHVYTLEWAEGVLQWFVDGKIVMRLTEDEWYTASKAADGNPFAPFDQPFYLNLNLAVGGNLSEYANDGGVDESVFPAEMLVDWVRVEKCAGDMETGLACLSNQKWEGAPFGPSENRAS